MRKNMQNLVFLMEPSKTTDDTSLKVGNMCLNRFSIDEDASSEISGVYYLKEWSNDFYDNENFEVEKKLKGEEN